MALMSKDLFKSTGWTSVVNQAEGRKSTTPDGPQGSSKREKGGVEGVWSQFRHHCRSLELLPRTERWTLGLRPQGRRRGGEKSWSTN